MKTTVPQWLTQGLVTLLVVAASLTAYDRWVLRPALVIGVVDVAEVYRAKEAEFTQILTKALSQPASEEERQKALVMARAFAQRLPLALDELPRDTFAPLALLVFCLPCHAFATLYPVAAWYQPASGAQARSNG